MATIKVEVTYDPKKETLSQALANLLTEKPEHTEITAQMSLFDNPTPTETPTAQTSTEAPQESPAESASEAPDTKPTEEKTISKADVRALAVKLSKNDKAALKAIFKELGVANLSAVKEEDYPVFYFESYDDHNRVLRLRRLFYSVFGFSPERIENFRERGKKDEICCA